MSPASARTTKQRAPAAESAAAVPGKPDESIPLEAYLKEYSLSDAAALLSRRSDEVSELLECGELHGYRRGTKGKGGGGQFHIPGWSIWQYQARQCARERAGGAAA